MKFVMLLIISGIAWLALGGLTGCKEDGNFYTISGVKGQVFREDPLLNPGVRTLADSVVVYLSRKADSIRLISTTAGADGRFSFSHKPEKQDLYFESTLIDKGIEYRGTASYGNQAEIVLLPVTKGLQVKVQDSTGAPLPRAMVCFSPSAVEISLNVCDSTSARTYSNEQGLAFIPLPDNSRPYYVKATRILGVNTLTGTDTVNVVGGAGIAEIRMSLVK